MTEKNKAAFRKEYRKLIADLNDDLLNYTADLMMVTKAQDFKTQWNDTDFELLCNEGFIGRLRTHANMLEVLNEANKIIVLADEFDEDDE